MTRIALIIGGIVCFASTALAGPESESTADQDTGSANWYQPSRGDRHIAWNTHDPWLRFGSSKRLAFAVSFDSFFKTDAFMAATGDDSAGEFGLRLDGPKWGGYVGRFPGELWMFGVSYYRHRAYQLYDNGVPDFGIGVLYPSVDLRVASDFDQRHLVNASLWLTGARFVWQDFVVVDVRLQLPGIWWAEGSDDLLWSWGLSLEAGVTF